MRERISQAGAARLRGVSRQRINELVKLGRISLATDADGSPLGGLWLDEVTALDLRSVGRPRKETIGSNFQIGDIIEWTRTPRRSFGYTVTITAKVLKVSAVRLKLAFTDSEGVEHICWAAQSQCQLASDNESGKIPESGKKSGHVEMTFHEKLKARMI